MDALSESDALMTLQGEGEEVSTSFPVSRSGADELTLRLQAYRRLPLTSLYAFQVSVRSTLLNLPSPVPRRKQVLRKSELWETLKLRRQNEEGLDEIGGSEGLWREEKRSVVAERVPWMGVIKPKGAIRCSSLVRLRALPDFAPAHQTRILSFSTSPPSRLWPMPHNPSSQAARWARKKRRFRRLTGRS